MHAQDSHSTNNTTMALDIVESAESLHKKQTHTIERKACKKYSYTLEFFGDELY